MNEFRILHGLETKLQVSGEAITLASEVRQAISCKLARAKRINR